MKEIKMKELIALAYRGVQALDAENAETKKALEQMMLTVLEEEKQKEAVQQSETTMNTPENAGNINKDTKPVKK